MLQFIKTNGVFGSDGNRTLNLVRVDEFARVDVNLR